MCCIVIIKHQPSSTSVTKQTLLITHLPIRTTRATFPIFSWHESTLLVKYLRQKCFKMRPKIIVINSDIVNALFSYSQNGVVFFEAC